MQAQHTTRKPWRAALGGMELLSSINMSLSVGDYIFFLIGCGEIDRGMHYVVRSRLFPSSKVLNVNIT